jgi:hypothetical protein
MLAAGLASVLIGGRGAVPASAASQHTIEILASGFNPALCTVNRNDSTVYFLNKDTKVRRVIRPAFTADPDAPPEWDSGDIQPGQTVVAFVVTSQVHIRYRDANIPEHTGEIIAPQSNNAAANCSPLPPTPTPTNTPTPTATPTPTPPRPPTPEACARLLANPAGCQVAPRIATDGPAR